VKTLTGMTTDVYPRENCIAPAIVLIVWTTNTKNRCARAFWAFVVSVVFRLNEHPINAAGTPVFVNEINGSRDACTRVHRRGAYRNGVTFDFILSNFFFFFSPDVRALFKKVTTRLLATYSLTPG
jgi:hypothetical protein